MTEGKKMGFLKKGKWSVQRKHLLIFLKHFSGIVIMLNIHLIWNGRKQS